MSFTYITLNRNPNEQSIIDYINEMSTPLYINTLEKNNLLVLNFSAKCRSSVSLLPADLQHYFPEKDRSTQVTVDVDLQVEKVKECIIKHFGRKNLEIKPTSRGYSIQLFKSETGGGVKNYL